MKFEVTIQETTNQISKEILNAILKEMSKSWSKGTQTITKGLPRVVIEGIKSQPEYGALLSGQLKFEFGLTNSITKVEEIINIWANNIVLTDSPPKIRGSQITASYSISMIKSDYSDVLSAPAAKQLIDGGNLPWLNWLLTAGGSILVPSYDVEFGPSSRSRTGGAIMVKGGSYRVDPKYAGALGNNWITRAVGSVNNNIEELITISLRSAL